MVDKPVSASSVAMRRIMKECKDMQSKKQAFVYGQPLENEPFEWHFTIRGPPKTDYEGGLYHGTITLPYEYPFKPPYIIFFTPSGRFQLHEKICLSFTNYHPEYWQPAWTIESILLALVSFFPVEEDQLAVGAIKASSLERKHLAAISGDFTCPSCKLANKLIADQNMLPLEQADEDEMKKELQGNQISEMAELKPKNAPSSKEKPADKIHEEVKELPPQASDSPKIAKESVYKEVSPLDKEPDEKDGDPLNKIMTQNLTKEQYDALVIAIKKSKRAEKRKAIWRQKETQKWNHVLREQNPAYKRSTTQGMSDVEKAKLTAAKIRQEGIDKYKQQLLAELDADKSRKLGVVNCLFILTIIFVGWIYLQVSAMTVNFEQLVLDYLLQE